MLSERKPVGGEDPGSTSQSRAQGQAQSRTPVGAQVGAQTPAQLPDEESETITGRVKWFDVVKGYGFITPDDDGGDVLVHYNLLGRHGRKSLPEGTWVRATVRQGARGRQASDLLEIDLSKATAPDADRAAPRGGNRVEPLDFLADAGDFELVQVRWFNRAKGYGFLLRDDGVTQIFVHMETVRRGGFETLLPGQALRARVHDGPRGALAVVVEAEGR